MLSGISWKDFFECMAVLLVLYYIYVVAKYYRLEVIGLVTGKRSVEEDARAADTRSGSVVVGPDRKPVGELAVVPVSEDANTGQPGAGVGPGGNAVGKAAGSNGRDSPLSGGAGGTDQVTLFKGEGPGPGQTPELFKVMEKVLTRLKGVVSQAVVAGTNRDELTDHVSEVLSGYRQLKGTPYQEAINNFLVRTCTSNFSFTPDEQELQGLWR